MDTLTFIRLLEIITDFIFYYSLNKALTKFFRPKYPFPIIIITYYLYAAFLAPSLFQALLLGIPLYLVNIIIVMLPLCFIYQGAIERKLFILTLACLLQILSEFIILTFFRIIKIDISADLQFFFITARITAPLIYYINYKLLIKISSVVKERSGKFHLMLASYCFGQYLIYVVLELNTTQFINTHTKILYFIIYIIFIWIAIYLSIIIHKNHKTEMKMKELENENKLLYEFFNLTKKNEDEIIKFRHDIGNHLLVIDSLIKTYDTKNAKQYYNELLKEFNKLK